MSFDTGNALPQLVNHLIVSCGIGLAGIVGAKATEEVRALTAGDQRADEMTALAVEIDSFRRRKELASSPGDRDWADVTVDRFSNIMVVPEPVPELESQDDLNAFDRLLTQSVGADSSRAQDSLPSIPTTQQLIDPSHFLMEDENSSPSS
ncbi:hypothetical protein FGB62_5g539 [Gracilaria domingensis]|nr:hypothetical protein FGB62_5g539 [Gracilaria domingensis]